MKITGIDIGDYRQFKNIKFDFTYPAGHPKEGQPLDKICFIGQSGTGKTTLLKIIEEYFKTIDSGLNIQQFIADKGRKSIQHHREDSGFINYEYLKCIKIYSLYDNRNVVFDRYDKNNTSERGGGLLNWLSKDLIIDRDQHSSKFCLFIPDHVSSSADSLLYAQDEQRENSSFIKSQQELDEENDKLSNQIKQLDLVKTVSLSNINYKAVWRYVLEDIYNYEYKLKNVAVQLIQGSETFSPESLFKKLADWKSANTNPRIELSKKCVDPILNKFFLEMNIDESTGVSIVIKNKNGTSIQNKYLSTGTKQVLTTAIPIYKLASNDTVVLFDEPERSLFPDIQRILIDYYISLAPEAQFFFATHSPIIASAFEPEERFILYFDKDGEVGFHNGVAPEGDDPNDILRQDFDMAELMLKKGLEAYEEYRRLAMQIRAETDEAKKNQLIAERLELGNRYNFAGQYAQSR